MGLSIPILSRVQYASLRAGKKSTGILFCYALTGARVTAILLPDNTDLKNCGFVSARLLATYGLPTDEDEDRFEARHPDSLILIEKADQIMEELLTHPLELVRTKAKELIERQGGRGRYDSFSMGSRVISK
jgi:hypothetical protein